MFKPVKYLLFFFIGFSFVSFSQTRVEGKVIDKKTLVPLAYVNIGIKNKNAGTISKEDGTFVISVPKGMEKDTLYFSAIGYKEEGIPVAVIASNRQNLFRLQPKNIQLPPLEVSAKKLVEKKYGIKNDPFLNFVDASINQSDIFEIAQVIDLPAQPCKITSVNLFIAESSNDSATFRINFYDYANGQQPGQKLNTQEIIQTHALKKGWLTFDLKKYNLKFKGKVIAAIEFIPASKRARQIFYEIKLGGFSRSFFRESSFGEWQVPPHHYRMFVTALVDEGKLEETESPEEKISKPVYKLYSEAVQDSFFIYVNLPAGYQKSKAITYPVVYLLDANLYFDPMSFSMQKLQKKRQVQDFILVGIGYKDFNVMDSLRERDYTYPSALPSESFLNSGGAEAFYTFIEKHLIPRIEKEYPNADKNKRVLAGHSLGGYFTLYALDKQAGENKKVFHNFISISPSLDYRDGYITGRFKKRKDQDSLFNVNVYLAMGAQEEDAEASRQKELENFSAFVKLLIDMNVKSEVFPKARHMQTAMPGFEKGIKFVLPRKN